MRKIVLALCLLLTFSVCINAQQVGDTSGGVSKTNYWRFWNNDTYESVLVMSPYWRVLEFDVVKLDTVVYGGAASTLNPAFLKAVSDSSTFSLITIKNEGALRVTTSSGDNDDYEMASFDSLWTASDRIMIEAIINNADSSGLGWTFGLCNADSAWNNDSLVVSYVDSIIFTNGNVDEFVGFSYDPDATIDQIVGLNVKASERGSVIKPIALAPSDGEDVIVRLEINSSGTAFYYIDGVSIGNTLNAVTMTRGLYLYYGVINREGSSNMVDIKAIKISASR